MPSPSIGLFAPLNAKPGQEETFPNFLRTGCALLADEPLTLQWYGVKYDGKDTYAIFDTFSEEEGRNVHSQGKIAGVLIANAPTLVDGAPSILRIKILAAKVQPADVKIGLRVLFEVKPEREEAMKQCLIDALSVVDAENSTRQWYAFHVENTRQFGIMSFYMNEAGRTAHLTGECAKAFFTKKDELLASEPDFEYVTVLAHRVM